jgi:epsilon-lactone hydrolase
MNWQTTTANLFARLTIKPLMKRQVSIAALRGSIDGFERLFPRHPPDCETTYDHPLPNCDAEWVRPTGLATDRVLLHFPGGAFVVRFPNFERSLVARVCQAAHARGRLVFYRLAPEDPYPAGHDDCLGAYRQLLDQGVKSDRIVLSGLSAGGGMALGVLLAIRDRGWPLPAGVVAMSPVTDLTEARAGSSRHTNAGRDAVLSLANEFDLREMYIGSSARLHTHPYVSPVFGDFAGAPPVLFQIGSTEVLLDDSRRAADRIRAAGVSAEVEVWDGMPHGWQGMPFLPESQLAIERIADFIRMQVP